MLLRNLHHIAFSPQPLADMLSKFSIPKKKIVIDFSSPNIAKTFHMGNLRSTLLGNFHQKICRLAGHDVVSLNYLGDWGQQFSLLAFYWLAVMDGSEGHAKRPDQLEWAELSVRQRVELLTKTYAAAHRLKQLNPAFAERAQKLFLGMEQTLLRPSTSVDMDTKPQNDINSQVNEAMRLWQEWLETSRQYLDDFYKRFGVHFDEWDGESAYVKEGACLVDQFIQEGKCQLSKDNIWCVRNPGVGNAVIAMRRDNANLYMNRELAAFYARHRRHEADEYVYVVDRQQANHFIHLKELLKLRGDADLAQRVHHYAYGRIIGLSTREGKNDSVDFLIDQGQLEAEAYVQNSHTKRSTEDEQVHLYRALAQSQLVFDIVSRAKTSDFTFTYKSAFKPEGTNALILQAKYSRLNSLEITNHEHMDRLRTMDQNALDSMRPEMLENAQKLAQVIHEFDTVLYNALERMEPSPVMKNLVRLCHIIGKAMPELRVLGEPLKVALPRLLLFSAAKRLLGEGMRLVGVEPIKRI